MSKMTKNEAVKAYLFCLITAFVVLMICTKSSFLYPFNDWVDANCYFSVGKSMMNGKVLYRDIYDHKGPLLYSLHAFAYVIASNNFSGVFLFEIIAGSLFLFSVYKILRLYVGKISLIAVPVVAALAYSALSFSHGDSAEEFCLPLLSWSLYGMLKYFKTAYPNRVDYKTLLLHGTLAGCVMWIKFTMLGFHFAWMVTIILIYATRKDWKVGARIRAIITDGLIFVGGMLIATIPFIIYFGIHGAIWDWLGGYIYNNVFVYTTDTQIQIFTTLKSIVRNALITLVENWQYSWLIIVGALWFLLQKKNTVQQKVGLILMVGLTTIGIYWGTQAYYKYYGFILCVFVVLGMIPILKYIEKKDSFLSSGKALLCSSLICVVVSAAWSFWRSPNIYLLGYPQEKMVQYKFKEIIEETENPTLLNYGFLDGGFYTVCDIVPTCKYFAKFNIPLEEIWRSQEDIIINGEVDYVVTRNFELDEMYEKYSLVAEDSFWFEGTDHQYYLYCLNVE